MNKELIIKLLQGGKDSLLNTFNAVPDDKLGWKPLDNGKAALDLFGEVAQMTGNGARLIETRGQWQFNHEVFAEMRAERAGWSREEAVSALEKNHAALIAAIEGCTEEELAQNITLQMGRTMTLSVAGWAMMGYRHYISRFAQINYIQTLYGDFDFH